MPPAVQTPDPRPTNSLPYSHDPLSRVHRYPRTQRPPLPHLTPGTNLPKGTTQPISPSRLTHRTHTGPPQPHQQLPLAINLRPSLTARPPRPVRPSRITRVTRPCPPLHTTPSGSLCPPVHPEVAWKEFSDRAERAETRVPSTPAPPARLVLHPWPVRAARTTVSARPSPAASSPRTPAPVGRT